MNTATSVYLTRLFENCPQHLGIELRPIHKQTREASCFYFTSRPDSLIRCCQKCADLSTDHDVYIGILPRYGRGNEDAHVAESRWLWIDLDAGDSDSVHMAAMLTDARIDGRPLPTPSMIVHSGSGGAHFYWSLPDTHLLNDPEERRIFSSVLRRLCLVLGGKSPQAHADTSCVNPSRILRVPGTFNHKHDPPREVELQICTPDIKPWSWWLTHLPFEPTRPKPQKRDYRPRDFGDSITPGVLAYAEQGYSEGRRHMDLAGAAKFFKRDLAMDDMRGFELLVTKANHSHGTRAITERELEDIWRWA